MTTAFVWLDPSPVRNVVVSCVHRGSISAPEIGRTFHENVIRPSRALGCRYPVNCIAVRPEQYGNVANRNRLRPATSQRYGGSAEAGGKAASAAAGGAHGCISPEIASRCNTIDFAKCHTGGARYNHGEACRVRENLQQLQRWLPNKFQVRQPTLEWMLGVGGVPPPFSATCRNVHNYKTYAECQNSRLFLGGNNAGAWWYCSSLLAGGKLAGERIQVAELKRSGRR
jgi:hypothetical protein